MAYVLVRSRIIQTFHARFTSCMGRDSRITHSFRNHETVPLGNARVIDLMTLDSDPLFKCIHNKLRVKSHDSWLVHALRNARVMDLMTLDSDSLFKNLCNELRVKSHDSLTRTFPSKTNKSSFSGQFQLWTCSLSCPQKFLEKMGAPLQGDLFELQRLMETEESALQFLRNHQCIRRTAPGRLIKAFLTFNKTFI